MNTLLAKVHAENMDLKRVIDYFGTTFKRNKKRLLICKNANLEDY